MRMTHGRDAHGEVLGPRKRVAEFEERLRRDPRDSRRCHHAKTAVSPRRRTREIREKPPDLAIFRHCQRQPEEQTNSWYTDLCGDGVRLGQQWRCFWSVRWVAPTLPENTFMSLIIRRQSLSSAAARRGSVGTAFPRGAVGTSGKLAKSAESGHLLAPFGPLSEAAINTAKVMACLALWRQERGSRRQRDKKSQK